MEIIKILKYSLFNLYKIKLENTDYILMVLVVSWIKKELIYIKDSLAEIIKGIILVALASSGVAFALLLRYLEYNGTIITFVGIVAEFISLFICYFLFRNYLKSEEKTESSKPKGKKI